MKKEDISKLEGEEYKKAVKKLKRKITVKKFLSDIIGVVLFFGIVFGGYKFWSDYKSRNALSDDSYKMETKRDNSYDGIYSLTKIDENGNNTWDGLMLFVVNDKIISCANYEYYPEEEWFSIPLEKRDNMLRGEYKYEQVGTGFLIDEDVKEEGYPLIVGAFVGTEKINLQDSSDLRTDYDYMKSCDIVPGYDEDSQEVWLSKLLSNKKSIYHDGYKLTHYAGYEDLDRNCKLNSGGCIDNLNQNFNAGLSSW